MKFMYSSIFFLVWWLVCVLIMFIFDIYKKREFIYVRVIGNIGAGAIGSLFGAALFYLLLWAQGV
jgi:hypothetical protein